MIYNIENATTEMNPVVLDFVRNVDNTDRINDIINVFENQNHNKMKWSLLETFIEFLFQEISAVQENFSLYSHSEQEILDLPLNIRTIPSCLPLLALLHVSPVGDVDDKAAILRKMESAVTRVCSDVLFCNYAGFDILNSPTVNKSIVEMMELIKNQWQ